MNEMLEYVEIPPGASPLVSTPSTIRVAPKVTTALPQHTPPRKRTLSAGSSLSSPTMAFLPQLLLSSSLPPDSSGSSDNASQSRTARKGDAVPLLLTRDPLSLPVMTSNFRRFVGRVGVCFWVMDRVEEVVFWKRGWKGTVVWMAAYAFLCYFPRVVLVVPHVVLISVILASYPYTDTETDRDTDTDHSTPEGSIPWQANIQGIQNIMGAYADFYSFVQPHTHHLSLHNAHSYAPHILTLLVITLPPLLFLVTLPSFPVRGLCLFLGIAPLICTNPHIQLAWPLFLNSLLNNTNKLSWFKQRLSTYMHMHTHKDPSPLTSDFSKDPPEHTDDTIELSVEGVLKRVVDDDRLSDDAWNAEMKVVELWENERFGGVVALGDPSVQTQTQTHSVIKQLMDQKSWGKRNLRVGERAPWTRGMDGWSGVEGSGEVSSNLTFSLAPGWRFVSSEDWRRDSGAGWAGCGGDEEGWVYTNDAWLGQRAAPYTAGGGSVTRRRRWTRRVWYDHTAVEG